MQSVFKTVIVTCSRIKPPFTAAIKTSSKLPGFFSAGKMPPVNGQTALKDEITNLIDSNKVMVFSKTTCGFCRKVSYLYCQCQSGDKVE